MSSDRPSSPDTPDDKNDGLDRVELSDLEASPPQLPIERDLMQLARLGELRAIQKLFDSGKYTARSTDEQGITALHWTAINGHHALCHFLIQSGADVNAKGGDADATPVLWASKRRGNLQVIKLLLDNGGSPLASDDQGYNLLHSATLDDNLFLLILLLHHSDISVDVADSNGHTSLMWAAYKGFPTCLDLLLRWGADVHAKDDTGFTALHWALVKGSQACIQKLLEYGSDRYTLSKPAAGETEGDTPAMTASKMKSERQWHKALLNTGHDETGEPLVFPLPFIKDRRAFYWRFFFFWPFVLGGIQLHMLAYMLVWIAWPGVLLVGYGLQMLVQKSFQWAPLELNSMHKVPLLAGIFAGSLFWVAVQYLLHILPHTARSHPVLNGIFIIAVSFCTYFYTVTMRADPGFIPKSDSRTQTKKTIDLLVENGALDDKHFCTTCLIRRPLRSKHCKRCGRCIAKEDHHCPWVDNCIGVNNHRQFLLYLVSMIVGLILLVNLTIAYLEVLPVPAELNCAILSPELCAQWEKDPLTIVTNIWGSLQLIWTVMLTAAQLIQIARGLTTYESMRANRDAGPLLTAVATGTTSREEANVEPESDHAHDHSHKKRSKKSGCCGAWISLLGLDTFFTIAFNGYHGSKNRDGGHKARRRPNPFYRGVFRDCEDFWLDGPIFGSKQSGTGLVGGERVDYTTMYDLPKGGIGYSGYEAVPSAEEGQLSG